MWKITTDSCFGQTYGDFSGDGDVGAGFVVAADCKFEPRSCGFGVFATQFFPCQNAGASHDSRIGTPPNSQEVKTSPRDLVSSGNEMLVFSVPQGNSPAARLLCTSRALSFLTLE